MTTTKEIYEAENVKMIAYAYPTSMSARQYLCGFEGCYVVRVGHPTDSKENVAGGFMSWDDANTAAEAMPEPFSPLSMKKPAHRD